MIVTKKFKTDTSLGYNHLKKAIAVVLIHLMTIISIQGIMYIS